MVCSDVCIQFFNRGLTHTTALERAPVGLVRVIIVDVSSKVALLYSSILTLSTLVLSCSSVCSKMSVEIIQSISMVHAVGTLVTSLFLVHPSDVCCEITLPSKHLAAFFTAMLLLFTGALSRFTALVCG